MKHKKQRREWWKNPAKIMIKKWVPYTMNRRSNSRNSDFATLANGFSVASIMVSSLHGISQTVVTDRRGNVYVDIYQPIRLDLDFSPDTLERVNASKYFTCTVVNSQELTY